MVSRFRNYNRHQAVGDVAEEAACGARDEWVGGQAESHRMLTMHRAALVCLTLG